MQVTALQPGNLACRDRSQEAHADPHRYLVLDAARPVEEITRQIRDRVRDLLPDPVPPAAEDATGSFPAIIE